MKRGPSRLLLLALAVPAGTAALAGRADAAFEIRPVSEFGSAFLPPGLPSAFSLSPSPASGWNAGALHLSPYAVEALSFDAIAVAAGGTGLRRQAAVSRLAAPGYAEWNLSAAAGMRNGPYARLELFLVQPSDNLRQSWGIRSRRAATISSGFSREWGARLRADAWVQDLLRTPGSALLGLTARAGGKLEFRAASEWQIEGALEWGGREGGAPAARFALTWSPRSWISGGHGWNAEPGSQVSWLSAAAGNATAEIWGAQVGEGVPMTRGFGIGLSNPAAVFPGRGSLTGGGRFGMLPRAASVVREETWDAPVFPGAATGTEISLDDSLGAIADSVEAETASDTIPADSRSTKDVPRDRPAGCLSVTRGWRIAKGRSPVAETSASVRADLRDGSLAAGVEGTDAQQFSGMRGSVEYFRPDLTLLAGRGGNPLVWGIGLAARGRGVWLDPAARAGPGITGPGSTGPGNTGSGTTGAGITGPGITGPAAWSRASALRPTDRGSSDVLGVEAGPVWGGARILYLGSGPYRWIGLRREGDEYRGGMLLRTGGGGKVEEGFWAGRSGNRSETNLELFFPGRGRPEGAVRASGSRGSSRAASLVWWDLSAQERLDPSSSLSRPDEVPETETVFRRRMNLGWVQGRRSLGAVAQWVESEAPAEADVRRREEREIALRGSAPLPRRARIGLRLDGKWTRSAVFHFHGLSFDNQPPAFGTRWRGRATAELPGPRSPDGRRGGPRPTWGFELGAESRTTQRSGGTMERSGASWSGLFRRGAWGGHASWGCGAMALGTTGATSTSVTPSWVGGNEVAAGAAGLWASVRLGYNTGPWRGALRGLVPWDVHGGAGGGIRLAVDLSFDRNRGEGGTGGSGRDDG